MRIEKYAAVLFVFCSMACTKNETVGPMLVNAPTYASALNAFSYSVKAQEFSSDIVGPLTFTCDSLAYSLSVTGHSYGSGSIALRADTIWFRTVDLSTNLSGAGRISMLCVPETAYVTLTRFSGVVSFAVAGIPRNSEMSNQQKSSIE